MRRAVGGATYIPLRPEPGLKIAMALSEYNMIIGKETTPMKTYYQKCCVRTAEFSDVYQNFKDHGFQYGPSSGNDLGQFFLTSQTTL